MYEIRKAKPAWQTQAMCRDRGLRSIVIRVEPECIAVRGKGTRTWLRLPWGTVFNTAARAEADAKRTRKQSIKRGGV